MVPSTLLLRGYHWRLSRKHWRLSRKQKENRAVARSWTSHPATSHSRTTFSKTHVSYKASSTLHASILQNERFVRDFLQKPSGNTNRQSEPGAHTSSSPARQFCDSSPSKQRLLTRQSHCHGDAHLHHNSRFPAPATKICTSTPPTCTKYCACHKM